jgi:uncharacterized protein YigE (DUF2233 family)
MMYKIISIRAIIYYETRCFVLLLTHQALWSPTFKMDFWSVEVSSGLGIYNEGDAVYIISNPKFNHS